MKSVGKKLPSTPHESPSPDEGKPRLPPELLDVVIDCLHGDKRTLQSCSLLCHALVSTARFHLFETIIITRRNFQRAKTLFFVKSPHLLSYARSLTLEALDDMPDDTQDRVRKFIDEQGLKPPAHTFISEIARLAPNVRHLGLKDLPLDSTVVATLSAAFPQLDMFTIFDCWFRSNADFYELVRSHPLVHTIRVGRLSSLNRTASPGSNTPIGPPIAIHLLKISEAYSPSPLTMMPWLTTHCHAEHFTYTLYRIGQVHTLNNSIFFMPSLQHLHINFYRWRVDGEPGRTF